MTPESWGGNLLSGRSIDNSKVVRELDPRSSRELVGLLLLVAALVAGAVLYAWPHFAARQTGTRAVELQRERERLVAEHRKLKLEKASLEDLRRIERIAGDQLGLQAPEAERVVVIERPTQPAPGARLARDERAAPAVN